MKFGLKNEQKTCLMQLLFIIIVRQLDKRIIFVPYMQQCLFLPKCIKTKKRKCEYCHFYLLLFNLQSVLVFFLYDLLHVLLPQSKTDDNSFQSFRNFLTFFLTNIHLYGKKQVIFPINSIRKSKSEFLLRNEFFYVTIV